MNEYRLPEEPAGPVWDQHGSRWVRIPETYPVLWKTDDDACHPTWGRLLEEYGPLSENAPVKIGTTVPYDMWRLDGRFMKLPAKGHHSRPRLLLRRSWLRGVQNIRCPLSGISPRIMIRGLP